MHFRMGFIPSIPNASRPIGPKRSGDLASLRNHWATTRMSGGAGSLTPTGLTHLSLALTLSRRHLSDATHASSSTLKSSATNNTTKEAGGIANRPHLKLRNRNAWIEIPIASTKHISARAPKTDNTLTGSGPPKLGATAGMPERTTHAPVPVVSPVSAHNQRAPRDGIRFMLTGGDSLAA